MVTLPLAGYLCENGFNGGWPSIFYVLGSIGILWFIVWMIFSSNEPGNNRFISESEKEYILNSTKIKFKNDRKQVFIFFTSKHHKIFLSNLNFEANTLG